MIRSEPGAVPPPTGAHGSRAATAVGPRVVMALALGALACASPRPTDPARDGGVPAAEIAGSTAGLGRSAGRMPAAAARDLAAALEAFDASGPDAGALRLLIECRAPERLRSGGAMRSLEVWGSGVAVWDGRRQLELAPAEIEWIVAELRSAGFAGMPSAFGRERPDPAHPREGAAGVRVPPMVLCRIRLALDDGSDLLKEVLQFDRGEVSEELVGLAGRLLDRFADAGERGLWVDDLDRGLALVAAGELAPEVLTLSLQRKPLPKPGQTLYGLLLELEGPVVTTHPYATAGGFRSARRLRLGEEELASLLRVLGAAGLAALPEDLYALHTTDLRVRILDQRIELQARRRPGVLPGTHGERQEAFDGVVAAVEELHRAALARGEILDP